MILMYGRMMALAATVMTFSGCAGGASMNSRDPARSYVAWRKAVRRGDPSAASMTKTSISPSSKEVSRGRVRKVKMTATTGRIKWILEDGQWRISRLPRMEFDNSTPLGAVRTFYLGVRYRRWNMVYRLLPSSISVHLTPQDVARALDPNLDRVKIFLEALGRSLKIAPLLVKGDTAYYQYDETKVLILKREEDGWHVESPY